MRKRYYLFLSLFTALALGVVMTSALAAQKSKAKEKTAAPAAQSRADSEAPQLFTLQGFGQNSYLGVYLEDVTPDRMKELNLAEERGAIVTKVVEGSPAEKAGLKENDVIVSFNERRIDSVRELQRILGETPADRNVRIEVVRGGSRQTLAATLSKRTPGFAYGPNMREWDGRAWGQSEEARKRAEEMRQRAEEALKNYQGELKNFPEFGNFNFSGPGEFSLFRGTRLGISAESLTEQLGEFFGVKEGRGVLVASVNENSAAARAGLKAGDVIIAIDDEKIDSVGALVRALAKKEGTVTVKIVRDRAEQSVNVTLEKRPEPVAPRRHGTTVSTMSTL